MNLPNLSKPVSRTQIVNESKANEVKPSGIACTICQLGCSALAPTPQALCLAACNATVCG